MHIQVAWVSSIHGYHYARLSVNNQTNGTNVSFVKVVISRYPIGLLTMCTGSPVVIDECGFSWNTAELIGSLMSDLQSVSRATILGFKELSEWFQISSIFQLFDPTEINRIL